MKEAVSHSVSSSLQLTINAKAQCRVNFIRAAFYHDSQTMFCFSVCTLTTESCPGASVMCICRSRGSFLAEFISKYGLCRIAVDDWQTHNHDPVSNSRAPHQAVLDMPQSAALRSWHDLERLRLSDTIT